MIERVARALYELGGKKPDFASREVPDEIREHARKSARAAIAAMREPTPEMLVVMACFVLGEMDEADPVNAKAAWQAGIDAALHHPSQVA